MLLAINRDKGPVAWMLEKTVSRQVGEGKQFEAALPNYGAFVFLGSCVALGLIEIVSRKPLPELHPWLAAPVASVQLSGAVLAGCALAAVRPSWRRPAGWVLVCLWLLATIATLIAAAGDFSDPILWVPVSKAVVFTLSAMLIGTGKKPVYDALRVTFGLTLIFYGLVHLFEHAAISGMIPGWLPKVIPWPFITGGLLIGSGFSLVIGKAIRPAAIAIAALFFSWILLLHIGRIAAKPESPFEWTFALSALALTGVAVLVAGQEPKACSSERCAPEFALEEAIGTAAEGGG